MLIDGTIDLVTAGDGHDILITMTGGKILRPDELSLIPEFSAQTECTGKSVMSSLLHYTLLTSVGEVGIDICRRAHLLAVCNRCLREECWACDLTLPVGVVVIVVFLRVVVPVRIEVAIQDLTSCVRVVPVLKELIYVHDVQILLDSRHSETELHVDCRFGSDSLLGSDGQRTLRS